jgi:hypothetical protein
VRCAAGVPARDTAEIENPWPGFPDGLLYLADIKPVNNPPEGLTWESVFVFGLLI